jgi:hypothetical protein
VQTAPILLPGQEPTAGAAPAPRNGGPVRIALLLPMNSSALGGAAESVRAGFMASVERDGAGTEVDLVPTGDSADDALAAYSAPPPATTSSSARWPVPPSRAGRQPAPEPADRRPEPSRTTRQPAARHAGGRPLDRGRGRQAAEWAAREHPQGRVLILTGNAPGPSARPAPSRRAGTSSAIQASASTCRRPTAAWIRPPSPI